MTLAKKKKKWCWVLATLRIFQAGCGFPCTKRVTKHGTRVALLQKSRCEKLVREHVGILLSRWPIS